MGYNKMGFETKVCSRCGGSGRYSWCAAYGSKCFQCHGVGYILTNKGVATLDFFRSSLEIDAKYVQVGMQHRYAPNSKWFNILEVHGLSTDGDISYSTNGTTYHRGINSKITVRRDIEEYNEKLVDAIRFQSRLTKAGKEMKKYLKMRGEV